jgi:Domain of unknown function (DUF2019)
MRVSEIEVHMPSTAEKYVQAAIEHGQYIKVGKSAASNRAHDRLHRALRELRAEPDRGETTLLGMLRHADESVRVWAATHLLPLNPDAAIPALEGVARGPGFIAFEALMVLKEWRAGRLKVE